MSTISVTALLAPVLYEPPDEASEDAAIALKLYNDKVADDVIRAQEMKDITMGGMGLGILGFFAVWVFLSFFSIICVHRRWFKATRSFFDKVQVNVMMLFAWVLGAATVGIFFVELEIQMMLALLLASNITYLWCVLFTLGFSRGNPKKIDGSFARIRTVFLFSTFLQIVTFVFSFAGGEFGGTCSEDLSLPYLFDAMYGLQFMAMIMFIFENCFGFGNKKNHQPDAKPGEEAKDGTKGK